MKIYGRIYLITNLINNKKYVGQTTTSIKHRFGQHYSSNTKNTIITKAIKKYGKENFKIEEISIAYNQKHLNFSEGFYIYIFNTLIPNGYNITNIINGKGKHSEKTKEKMKIIQNTTQRLRWASKNGKRHRGKIVKNSICNYIGVHSYNYKYISQICFNNKRIYLGCYSKEIDAAKAYDIAAIKYFGNDCNLNFSELRQDYINNQIIVKKILKKDRSKSGESGVYFEKNRNKWRFKWFDKKLNKEKSKMFTSLEMAIEFKKLMESK